MKRTILIVEDDLNIAKAQEMILQDDFEVHTASNGEEGLLKAIDIKPDLIILDWMLPNMDGISVLKEIRKNQEIQDTKIIMVTAKDQDKDEVEGMDNGADDYIMKPFEADELMHVVNQVFK